MTPVFPNRFAPDAKQCHPANSTLVACQFQAPNILPLQPPPPRTQTEQIHLLQFNSHLKAHHIPRLRHGEGHHRSRTRHGGDMNPSKRSRGRSRGEG